VNECKPLINGTLRDSDAPCYGCGRPGHTQDNCPDKDIGGGFRADVALVTCKICGDGGHPTIDCPMKGRGAGAYTRQLFGSKYAHFAGYVGCMIIPQDIRQGDTGRCDQNGLG
jgi:splicing factor 1